MLLGTGEEATIARRDRAIVLIRNKAAADKTTVADVMKHAKEDCPISMEILGGGGGGGVGGRRRGGVERRGGRGGGRAQEEEEEIPLQHALGGREEGEAGVGGGGGGREEGGAAGRAVGNRSSIVVLRLPLPAESPTELATRSSTQSQSNLRV